MGYRYRLHAKTLPGRPDLVFAGRKAVFFVGATAIHFGQYGHAGALTHTNMLLILATHGLISVIILAGLGMSGVWRGEGRTREDAQG